MRYVLLIYDDESRRAHRAPEAAAKVHEDYMVLTRDLRERGVSQAGEALAPTRTAVCVRKQGGKVLTTDGPYAETKEALGGFYLVHAADVAEARAIALRIPSVEQGGVIEIRPVVEFPPQ